MTAMARPARIVNREDITFSIEKEILLVVSLKAFGAKTK
jgi:hypothetical protein